MSGQPGLFTNRIKLSFIPEATIQEQDAFLSQPGFFTCEIQSCRMKESSCIKNQQISRENTRPGSRELHRDFCIGCKQGAKIAKKYKITLKEKEPHKCPRCGKVVEEKINTSYTCMDCRVKLNRERLEALEAGNTPSQIFEALA